MARRPPTVSVDSGMASIAAMPKLTRLIVLALILAATSVALGSCGGDDGPDPSLSSDESALLTAKLQEIQENIDVGSCLVAASRTDDLLADVNELPSSVDQQVRNALVRGATNLKDLLEDPDKCESRTDTTTTEPTTTEETTTQETTTRTQPETTTTRTQTQPSTTTTQTQTQTQTQPSTTTPGGSGGIGPGGL
jgi:hypothetical protein